MRSVERFVTASLFMFFLIIAGCGSSSTDSDTDSESTIDSDSTTTKSSSVTCGQDNLCNGTYTTNVLVGEGLLNGSCEVSYVDSGSWVKIILKKSSSCDFKSIRAKGDIGLHWAALAAIDKKLLINHKGEDVYLIRVFID